MPNIFSINIRILKYLKQKKRGETFWVAAHQLRNTTIGPMFTSTATFEPLQPGTFWPDDTKNISTDHPQYCSHQLWIGLRQRWTEVHDIDNVLEKVNS